MKFCHKNESGLIKACFKGDTRVLDGCFKDVIRVGIRCINRASQFLAGGGGGQQCRRASYRLNCSLTNLVTDLPMVCKFKFVRYGHIKKKDSALCTSV